MAFLSLPSPSFIYHSRKLLPMSPSTTHQPKSYAVLSVSDKTGIAPIALALAERGITILASDGTHSLLRQLNYFQQEESKATLVKISDYTGHPEILNGRVKTLHPKIYAGILAKRDEPSHQRDLAELSAGWIDYVVVNCYPLPKDSHNMASDSQLQELIDIGGPCMLRAAAKNWSHIVVCTDVADYPALRGHLSNHQPLSLSARKKLASKVFRLTSALDSRISKALALENKGEECMTADSLPFDTAGLHEIPLRYGENSHQRAVWLSSSETYLGKLTPYSEKQLSYNNYLDLHSATRILREFHRASSCVVIKHGSPCGFACSQNHDSEETLNLVNKALSSDSLSAYGGVVSCNFPVEAEHARRLSEIFLEVIMAPSFSSEAVKILSAKPTLGILEADWLCSPEGLPHAASATEHRTLLGGVLWQESDPPLKFNDHGLLVGSEVVSQAQPSQMHLASSQVAFRLVKNMKSNAICLVSQGMLLAQGSGFTSRIEAAQFAVSKARRLHPKAIADAALASDGFFPFRDVIDYAASCGIGCVMAPSGSKRDGESQDAANQHGIALIFHNTRHFLH